MIPEKVATFRAHFRDEVHLAALLGRRALSVHVDRLAHRRRLVRSDGARAARGGSC